MANFKILAPFILSHEGGFVNDPRDSGGATNMGVTLGTWRKIGYDKDGDDDIDVDDIRLLTESDAVENVMRPHYWNKCMADKIKCQAIANLLVDWAWCSGVGTAAKHIQRILKIKDDGVIGNVTVNAINSHEDYFILFNELWIDRMNFILSVMMNNRSKSVFFNGWKRRIINIQFDKLILNNGKIYEF